MSGTSINKWTLRRKVIWIVNKDVTILNQEDELLNVARKVPAIMSQSPYIKPYSPKQYCTWTSDKYPRNIHKFGTNLDNLK